jgi:hypothetical protein
LIYATGDGTISAAWYSRAADEVKNVSFMLEVYYSGPPDPPRERRISTAIARHGGRLTYREAPYTPVSKAVCLTYEFECLSFAQSAAAELARLNEHVEGPVDYGQ